MTLTNRLSLFFLTTLGVVLIGFSITLFLFASIYLHRQTEQRLEAAINTLTAAAEIGSDGVEWEPVERKLIVEFDSTGGQIAWVIMDDQGQPIDQSQPSLPVTQLSEAFDTVENRDRQEARVNWEGERWKVRRAFLVPNSSKQPVPAPDIKYQQLSVIAAIRLNPIGEAKRQLGAVLVVSSLAVWLAALLAGRIVCRRALSPVTRMAVTARTMGGDNLTERLPVPASGDELEDLGRSFNTLLDKVQEALERQQRFTGDASHQLRTPLTAILGQIDVALRRERTAEEYKAVLSTVQQRAKHLTGIVEALLFLARADADARLPNVETVDLSEWITLHVSSWSEHPRSKDFQLEVSDPNLVVSVPPVLLGELLNVLLDNACKYSRPGTPIVVRMRRLETEACVEVEDYGCGISVEDRSQLFRPFFRSPSSLLQAIDGTGLGLAIAARLVRAIAGRLEVSSVVNQGSCFRVYLPLCKIAVVSPSVP